MVVSQPMVRHLSYAIHMKELGAVGYIHIGFFKASPDLNQKRDYQILTGKGAGVTYGE
jgi:hypothetical protein